MLVDCFGLFFGFLVVVGCCKLFVGSLDCCWLLLLPLLVVGCSLVVWTFSSCYCGCWLFGLLLLVGWLLSSLLLLFFLSLLSCCCYFVRRCCYFVRCCYCRCCYFVVLSQLPWLVDHFSPRVVPAIWGGSPLVLLGSSECTKPTNN